MSPERPGGSTVECCRWGLKPAPTSPLTTGAVDRRRTRRGHVVATRTTLGRLFLIVVTDRANLNSDRFTGEPLIGRHGRVRVVIVPGLAVRSYAVAATEALVDAGFDARLDDPPGWPGQATGLDVYGLRLATALEQESEPVDLLVGLSVGTQAAAIAARHIPVGHLLLVSPTVPPQLRSEPRLLVQFLRGENHRNSPSWRSQLPDWRRAGPRRILACFRSATTVVLEDVLPTVTAPVTIVHGDADQLSTHSYAASLANRCGASLTLLPDAPHSWPVGDPARFVTMVEDLTRDAS